MPSHFSCVQLFVTLWTVAHQSPLSMRLSRQEHWSGLPCPPAGDLPDLGIEPVSSMFTCTGGGFFTTSATWEAHILSSRTCKLSYDDRSCRRGWLPPGKEELTGKGHKKIF